MRGLTKVQFLILTSLLRCPMHLYALRQAIIDLTDHQYYPTSSTLKTAVGRLSESGLVEECFSNSNYWLRTNRGAPYELTAQGRKRIEREVAIYFKICQVARIWYRQSQEITKW